MRHQSARNGCFRRGVSGPWQQTAACAVLCCGSAGSLQAAAPPQAEPQISKAAAEIRLCAAAPETVKTVAAGVGHAWELHFQLRPVPESAPCLTPDPVCLIPHAVTGTKPVEVSPQTTPPGPFLERWARATEQRPALSDRDAQWIRRMNAELVSNSQLDEAMRFLGRVVPEDLETRFDWTVQFEAGGIIELRGQPQDATEKLFASGWEITLFQDRRTPLQVTQLAVQKRDGQWQTLRLPVESRVEKVQLVQHTDAEDPIPPSPANFESFPAPVIRFAGGVIEIEIE